MVRDFFARSPRETSAGASGERPRVYLLPKDERSLVVVWHVPEENRPTSGTLRVFEGFSQVHAAEVDWAKGAFEVTGLLPLGRYRAEIQAKAHGVIRSERDVVLPPKKAHASAEVTWGKVRIEEGRSAITEVYSRPRPQVAACFAEETVSSSRFTSV